MNQILYLLLVVISFSCKSNNSIVQEKEHIPQKPIVEKPKFGEINDVVDPNTVVLVGTVQGRIKQSNICGKNYNATVLIKVNNILSLGSGIVNMISNNQEVIFAIKNRSKQDLIPDEKIFLTAIESLCLDMSQTVYEITSYKDKN